MKCSERNIVPSDVSIAVFVGEFTFVLQPYANIFFKIDRPMLLVFFIARYYYLIVIRIDLFISTVFRSISVLFSLGTLVTPIDQCSGMYICDSTMNCDLYVRMGTYHLLNAENILCNVSRK